ncbi:MAG: hypothetical protein J5706_04120 [Elusimicrobiales bacterium]|nr:hypothetical protein [Elusimicrobiales bacterium]
MEIIKGIFKKIDNQWNAIPRFCRSLILIIIIIVGSYYSIVWGLLAGGIILGIMLVLPEK